MRWVYLFCLFLGFTSVASSVSAEIVFLAEGTLEGISDKSGLSGRLENGLPANLLGGVGSGLAYAGGDTFLALPDRGPNATPYNDAVDNTVSYICRFHTVTMTLTPNPVGSARPFKLTSTLQHTTLLSNPTPLVYGSGLGLGDRKDRRPIGPGTPAENTATTFYFTGRSDNFHPGKKSTYSGNARLDPESIRVSKDGKTVFISDEYGPYVYEFDRTSGRRIRSISLPAKLPVRPSPTKKDEIKGNNSGRTANKGMEGLAITPDGKTLVGIMQAPLLQDSHNGAKKLLRIIIIDIARGDKADRPEYGYKLTLGTGVSEILAINDHQFLVLERDDKGLGDDPEAKVKRLFAVDLSNPRDIANLSGAEAEAAAVPKTEFLNIVKMLKMQGIETPEKIEGLAFGPDVMFNGARKHTLFVANDNDFIPDSAEKNHFFVFGFDDSDLPNYTPQRFADEK